LNDINFILKDKNILIFSLKIEDCKDSFFTSFYFDNFAPIKVKPMKLQLNKITLVLFINCLLVFNLYARPTHPYVQQYKSLSDSLSVQYGIPSSVILSIAILESDYGRSRVAVQLHNHFGFTGVNKAPWRTRFKQYATDRASFVDFCDKIATTKFYAQLKGTKSLSKWILHISRMGYSTQPKKWKRKVMKTILVNKL
jgi:Bax protein